MQIEIKNITKKFDQTKVLDQVSLHLETGLFGLLGANGAGKTTLIRILATLLEPTSGEILYNGQPIHNKKEMRQRIGYIPQCFSFYPSMTVFETLDYFCSLAGMKKNQRKAQIQDLLEKVNLLEVQKRRTKELSGGMRQRLGIAAALIGSPPLLLVDEPTVGLDPRERMKFRNILVDFSKDRIVLMSTHIVSDIEETCKNLAIMNRGHVAFQGTREELAQEVSGRVWQAILDDDQQRDAEKNYIITGKLVQQQGTLVRMLAAAQPYPQAELVEPNWFLYAEPLSLSKFAYIELKTVYESNQIVLYQKEGSRFIEIEYCLNQQNQKQILDTLKKMNPQYTKDEQLSSISLVPSEEQTRIMVRELEKVLGGVLAEGSSHLEGVYDLYLHQRNNACTNPTPQEQMEQIEQSLAGTLNRGTYDVYQWGIGPEYRMFFGNVKQVRFTAEQYQQILTKLQEMNHKRQTISPAAALRYYEQACSEIDSLLGANTMFAEDKRRYISERLNTWEEERAVFQEILTKDEYTRAYARYFCDYLGITAGILPVLYAAFLFAKDRRNRIQEFIMVSPQKSIQIVGKRMTSVLAVFMAWYILAAALATGYFAYIGSRFGYSMDRFAFFKYVVIWLLPTLCFTISLSVFLDLLFQKSLLVVLIQLLLFFLSIEDLAGSYPLWKPIIRYNVIGNYNLYEKSRELILANRVAILLLSFLLFAASVCLYERNRQGKHLLLLTQIKSIWTHATELIQKSKIQNSITTFMQNSKLWKSLSIFIQNKPPQLIKPQSDPSCKMHSWLYYQMKQTFCKNILFALLFVCFISILMQGFANDLEQLKRIGENYLTLSSIFLFVPLCSIEKNSNVYEVTCVQRKAYTSIYLMRVCAACLLQAIVLAVPLTCYILRFGYHFGLWCVGIYISTLFLGLLGLLIGEKTGSRRMGIAAILGYYLLCVSMKNQFKWLTICGYTYHISKSKYRLAAGCLAEIIMLTILLLYRSHAKRRNVSN